jgi:hypothetical protein
LPAMGNSPRWKHVFGHHKKGQKALVPKVAQVLVNERRLCEVLKISERSEKKIRIFANLLFRAKARVQQEM